MKSGAHINLGSFMRMLSGLAISLVLIADIIFGFFWLKGFYYCGKVIAWISIAAFCILVLVKIANLSFWSRIRNGFAYAFEKTPDTESAPASAPVAPATTSTPAPKTATPLSKEDYEKAKKELLSRYEAAVKAGDVAREAEVVEEIRKLKERAPKAPSADEIKKKIADAQKLFD